MCIHRLPAKLKITVPTSSTEYILQPRTYTAEEREREREHRSKTIYQHHMENPSRRSGREKKRKKRHARTCINILRVKKPAQRARLSLVNRRAAGDFSPQRGISITGESGVDAAAATEKKRRRERERSKREHGREC